MADMAAKTISVLFLAVAAIAGGCANKASNSTGANDPTMDLNSPSAAGVAAVAPSASYVPPDPQPMMADPITPMAATPVIASEAQTASIDGGTYVVKKGDTLYRIAKAHYGSGKQWQRIAAANPGTSPQTLRVGQRLVLPQ
jgi:5'-nucleotidase / UDP-sugar diphosphatase